MVVEEGKTPLHQLLIFVHVPLLPLLQFRVAFAPLKTIAVALETDGITGFDAALATLVPAALVAVTVKV